VRFPLRVSANGRYLVDRHGTPFRLNAEAAWFFSTHATPADVLTYLDDRPTSGEYEGEYQAADGGPTFKIPGDNGTGATDWVLVGTTSGK